MAIAKKPNTASEILTSAQKRLKNVSDAPALDAQWLLLRILKKDEAGWLLTHAEKKLNQKQIQDFENLIARRAKGEPLAYILEQWEFYGRKFYVNSSVLVPRPTTELLVEKTLRVIKDLSKKKSKFVIADIGTGSGCIIVTLCLEIRKWKIENMSTAKFQFIATDISPTALDVAHSNAKRHGVLNKIEFRQGDMLEPLKNEHIDLIVSNPPYIPSSELSMLNNGDVEKIGLNFEPKSALDGGTDGQKYINQIKTAGIPAVVEGTNGTIRFLEGKKASYLIP